MKTEPLPERHPIPGSFYKNLTTIGRSYRSVCMKATAPAEIDMTQFVATHYATLWRYLRLIGCEASLAEDICQETFLYLLQKPVEHRNEKSTLAYVRIAAKNRFIDELRRRQKTIPTDLDLADQVWDEFSGSDQGQTWMEALQECLKRLMGKARLAIDLQYRDHLSIAEIAESLGMKTSGVKTLLGRTRQRLRQCVENRANDSD